MNIYLPDDLAAAVRTAGINLSSLTQDAIRRHLAGRTTDAWLATLQPAASPVSHDDALAALDAARDEPATRHG
ncbi:type II toxin-antitoxin system CcdA family antitoxin [Geodermatophilus pulveris]|uniref:type II toxin-antitoxin system CcdA family antitoxin n=1 Tax=Geodermatophilus pulveris TaxID=1564159 RepID=UPI001C531CB9|nr:type II toxin-antitoxin system CcdA family antitoxin [Geodermatophilus pulveris]